MRYLRAVMLGAAILGASATWAAAQNLVMVQYGDRDDRQVFREGYRQGQGDARRGRGADPDDTRWREGDDRRAFREGYMRGYGDVRGGYYTVRESAGYDLESVRHIGFEDGVNDGRIDRRTGHSFRPTHDSNFKHADRGYFPGFGGRDYYKQIYREGYENGYRQGYENARR
ncbi:MAG TPA: hypothetical protein VKW06_12030 [Candidatus Angelobacter sp.]|nr:hypothetical protein [Candidatus Angelobacter sp.]